MIVISRGLSGTTIDRTSAVFFQDSEAAKFQLLDSLLALNHDDGINREFGSTDRQTASVLLIACSPSIA